MPNVLLIEDSTDLGTVLEQLLAFQGYGVMWGRTARHGIDLLNTRTPDAIICDMMLPDMDGITLLDQLRQNPVWRDIPVVVVSGNASPEMRARSLDRGANAFIQKPFPIDELLNTLNRLAMSN